MHILNWYTQNWGFNYILWKQNTCVKRKKEDLQVYKYGFYKAKVKGNWSFDV